MILSKIYYKLVLFIFLALQIQYSTCGTGETWAVVVSSSRNWLNYRHTTNALAIYDTLRKAGVPDSRIILMLAETYACDPRNTRPGGVFVDLDLPSNKNLYPKDIEVDYRGVEADPDALLRVLTDQHPAGTPSSKRLMSGPDSNVLVYLTGHGGDEFLKFHDKEELLAADIAGGIESMNRAGRYGKLLLLLDTCQAATLWDRIGDIPNVMGIASSPLGQSSYAHVSHAKLGTHTIDQFTYYLAQFLDSVPSHKANETSFGAAIKYVESMKIASEVVARSSGSLNVHTVMIDEFFGSGVERSAAGEPRPFRVLGETKCRIDIPCIAEKEKMTTRDILMKAP